MLSSFIYIPSRWPFAFLITASWYWFADVEPFGAHAPFFIAWYMLMPSRSRTALNASTYVAQTFSEPPLVIIYRMSCTSGRTIRRRENNHVVHTEGSSRVVQAIQGGPRGHESNGVTLNDVIPEPAIAVKVSERAIDLAKAEVMEKERGLRGSEHWSKLDDSLFGSSSRDASLLLSTTRIPPLPTNRGHRNARVSRLVPNTGRALAASATMVNIEFSGTGTGKSVTIVFPAHPDNDHLLLPHSSASNTDQLPCNRCLRGCTIPR